MTLAALWLLLAASGTAAPVEICHTTTGAQFPRLTAKECAAQGWRMRVADPVAPAAPAPPQPAEPTEAPPTRPPADIGPEPIRSNWDGAYYEVQNWLEERMHDPDSLEFVGCGLPQGSEEGWRVACEWRGKNAFGALVKSSAWFWIRHGRVVRSELDTP
jgi:hypothetical protein